MKKLLLTLNLLVLIVFVSGCSFWKRGGGESKTSNKNSAVSDDLSFLEEGQNVENINEFEGKKCNVNTFREIKFEGVPSNMYKDDKGNYVFISSHGVGYDILSNVITGFDTIKEIRDVKFENGKVSFIGGNGQKEYIYYNGNRSLDYDSISEYYLNNNFDKYALVGKNGDKYFFDFSGSVSKGFDSIYGLNFDDSFSKYNYIGIIGDREVFIENGEQKNKIENVIESYYNGNDLYLILEQGSKFYYLKNYQVVETFDGFSFRDESNNLYVRIGNNFVKYNSGNKEIILEGVYSNYENISVLNQDGSSFYFDGMKGGKSTLMDGSEIIGEYPEVIQFVLSKDNSSYSFIAYDQTDNKKIVFKDGNQIGKYDNVYDVHYLSDNSLVYISDRDGMKSLMVNGDSKGKFSEIGGIVISENASKYLFKAKEGTDWLVYKGLEKLGEYGNVIDIKISPDGNKYLYLVKEDGKNILYNNGIKSREYDYIDEINLTNEKLSYSFLKDDRLLDVECYY